MPVALPALAYVDPASSSLILQVVLGGLAGLGVALRLLWGRIRRSKPVDPQQGDGGKTDSGPSR